MDLNIIIFFILGTILGSFYAVIGYRLPKHESVVKPSHSYCDNCHKRLAWYELIPLLSYIIQLGKCRKCHQSIPVMLPFVELVTGALFAVSYYSYGFSYELIIALVLVSLFSIVIVSDLTYMIIPDEVTFTCCIIIAVVNFLNLGIKGGLLQIGSGIVTFMAMYLIMLLGNYIFKKETLGGADIKLMLVAGLSLSPILGIMVIFIASAIALPVSILIYVVSREHALPFGPFIVAAILLFFLLKIDINTFKSLLH